MTFSTVSYTSTRVRGQHLHVKEGRLPLNNEGFQPDAESLVFVRPHELKIETNLSDGVGLIAEVERVLAFGSTTRIDLAGASGQSNRFYEVEYRASAPPRCASSRGRTCA